MLIQIKRSIILTSVGLFFLGCLTAPAVALTGREIAERVYRRDDGDDTVFKTTMVLVDKRGHERKRVLETSVKDDEKGLVKTFLEFQSPPDIKDTRFLSWENADDDDTQYLYLPALGRSRRIVSNQKKLSFVNTDFTYEDMQRRLPDKDDHTLLGEVMYLDRLCYFLESIPKPDTSQYSRRRLLVDKESWVILAVNFFDKKDRRVKTLRVKRLENIDGIWTPMETVMRDLKSGHRTEMIIDSVVYNQGIDDEIFSLRYLERK